MKTEFLGLFFLFAILEWLVVGFGRQRLRYFTKPAALLTLCAWFYWVTGWRGSSLWAGLALIFCLAGDIALMIPRNWFLIGLTSFMLGHIAYIIALNTTPPVFTPISITIIFLLIPWALVYYRVIRGGLAKVPGNRRLRVDVGIYTLVITVMLISAAMTLFRPEWNFSHALLVTAGALMFVTSDSILGYDRFCKKIPYGRVLVMVTYHLGQLALAVGIALHVIYPV